MRVQLHYDTRAIDRAPGFSDVVDSLEGCLKEVGVGVIRSEEVEETDLIYSLPTKKPAMVGELGATDIPIVNSPAAHIRCLDKTVLYELGKGKIPMPDTLITNEPEEALAFLRKHGGTVLVKNNFGCGGEGHFFLMEERGLLNGKRDEQGFYVEFGEGFETQEGRITLGKPYFVQQFIANKPPINDFVLRTYIVGNEVLMAIGRTKNPKNLSESIISVSSGAKPTIEELTDETNAFSLTVAELIGFEAGAVDFVFDKAGRPFVLEANCDGYQFYVGRPYALVGNGFDQKIAKRLVEIIQSRVYRRPPGFISVQGDNVTVEY